MGAAGLVMFKTEEVSDTGQPIWVLKVSEPLARTESGKASVGCPQLTTA